jgi:NADH:ubiquinone oxidoreductase subunit K
MIHILAMKSTQIITSPRKSIILVYIVTALMFSSAAIYFIAASQDYNELSQSTSSSAESKDQGDIIATRNETIFFIVVALAFIAVGTWILKNKYHSKVPYFIAVIGSLALIAFYISTRTINIPPIGLQDDIGTIDIVAKVLQAVIAGVSIYILRSSIGWGRQTTTTRSPEILQYEEQKIQKSNKRQSNKERDFPDNE